MGQQGLFKEKNAQRKKTTMITEIEVLAKKLIALAMAFIDIHSEQVPIHKKLFRKLRKFSAKNIENMISLSRSMSFKICVVWKLLIFENMEISKHFLWGRCSGYNAYNFTFSHDNDLPAAGKSWNYHWVVPKSPSQHRCHGISSKSFSPKGFVDLMSQGKETKDIDNYLPPRSGMEHFVRTSYSDPGSKMLRSLKRQRTGRISQLSDNKNIPTFVLPLKGEWNSYHSN